MTTIDVLTINRVLDAPRELVFACLTEPDHLAQFWGPTGMHTPPETISVDLRPGGEFRTVMVNDDSGDTHASTFEYIEVEPPSKLSWRDVDNGIVSDATLVELEGGRTELVIEVSGMPPVPEIREGFESSIDRFVAYVAAR